MLLCFGGKTGWLEVGFWFLGGMLGFGQLERGMREYGVGELLSLGLSDVDVERRFGDFPNFWNRYQYINNIRYPISGMRG
jgi:hypothetical protein